MLKKLNVGGYLNVLAALLGLAGTILTIVSGMVSADNPLANTALIAVAGFGGVALCLLAILAPSRWGNFDMVGSVSILGAIALRRGRGPAGHAHRRPVLLQLRQRGGLERVLRLCRRMGLPAAGLCAAGGQRVCEIRQGRVRDQLS